MSVTGPESKLSLDRRRGYVWDVVKPGASFLLLLSFVPVLANAGAVAAGTRFRVLAFGENDPLAGDPALLGMECVATGEGLTRYAGAPFHFGMAACGADGKTFDLLAAKIELLGVAAKPAATKKPAPVATAKPLSNAKPVAPGTRFRILEFGENDPLAGDSTLIGMECVADGFLLRYQHVPFHYGQAKCGADEKPYDLLAAKIEVVELPKP